MSNLVTDRQPCPEHEKQELLAYLRANSHVQQPVQMIEAGCPLEKGKVKGIANIGQLVTYFRNLGNTYSQKLHGTEFFSVAQALEVSETQAKTSTQTFRRTSRKSSGTRIGSLDRIPVLG
jgi:hypothetical protein